MPWKKLLDTKDLIAYEKSTKAVKVRIEARFRKNRWRIYKTYNFRQGDEWVSHVKEYIAASQEETNVLLGELSVIEFCANSSEIDAKTTCLYPL